MGASLLNPDALVKLVEDAVRRALKEHVPQTAAEITSLWLARPRWPR
jgi:hypothetical protein